MAGVDPTSPLAEMLARCRRLLSSDPAGAIVRLDAVLAIAPHQADALWMKVRALEALGRVDDAIRTSGKAVNASLHVPELRTAAQALRRGEIAAAEGPVRTYLGRSPDNIMAGLMLADIATRVGIYHEAERLLRAAKALVPSYPDVNINLAMLLFQRGQAAQSIAILDDTIALSPEHSRAIASKANILAQIGDYNAAAACYRTLLELGPDSAEVWVWYGNVLKTIGDQPEAKNAYRRAIALDPELAEAWWSLTELKGDDLTEADLSAISEGMRATRDPAKQIFYHFALGRGLENRKKWKRSFEHYAEGNRLRLLMEPHDSAAVSIEVDRSIALFKRQFLIAKANANTPTTTPIFVLGMPRAGSTLVEQILASHSSIEGTSELPDIPLLARSTVTKEWTNRLASYPESIKNIDQATIDDLTKRYLSAAAYHRKTSTPWFIDKLPNNWRYIGLIYLMFPNAKIIDARRDAMACCFSNFKQHFTRGQAFSYSLSDLAQYYRDYIRMIDHFDQELPGTIHRVQHEKLLDDTRGEVRALLDFIGAPFEERCLRPHENSRPVRTASSEQVRKPISKNAIDQWRHFEPWLTELRVGLGNAWSDTPEPN